MAPSILLCVKIYCIFVLLFRERGHCKVNEKNLCAESLHIIQHPAETSHLNLAFFIHLWVTFRSTSVQRAALEFFDLIKINPNQKV